MLFIVCALPCEARPLIYHFRLQLAENSSPFPIYRNSHIALIVSGVGKISTAAAMGYLQALFSPTYPIWLNVGIAGHVSFPIGTGILAHRITDLSTGKCHYPVFIVDRPVKTASLLTVDRIQDDYIEDHVHDMEASAFWSVGSRFSTAELVHCYKIISDNASYSFTDLTKEKIQELVAEHLQTLEKWMNSLKEIANSIIQDEIPSEEVVPFLNRWHFTATQKHQLKRLLQRWKACTSLPIWTPPLEMQTKSRHVLDFIEKELNQCPFQFNLD